MRKFDYRAARFPVDLLVRVTFEDSTWIGRCTEISTEGMRLECTTPLVKDAFGALQVTFQGVTLDIAVRVARRGETCDGLCFLYATEAKREEVVQLIDRLTNYPNTELAIQIR